MGGALLVVQLFLLVTTAWDKSDTADEIRYVASGVTLWATGRFRDLCEAPVLPKWAFAAALRSTDPRVARAPASWQETMGFLVDTRTPPELLRMFFTARLATIAATLAAGLLLWRAAARFGTAPGLVALTLWVFSPTVLANGSLATLDAWAAASVCALVLAGVRFYEKPSGVRAAVLGFVSGSMAATKVPALLIVPIGLGLAFAFGRRGALGRLSRRALAARAAVVAGVAMTTLWGLYGFTVGGIDAADPCSFAAAAEPALGGAWPFPAWFEGLLFQLRHAAGGHANYLLGQTSSEGWWFFYLVALALKTTLAVQALVALRLAAAWWLARRGDAVDWRLDAALLAFPATLLALMSAGRHQPNVGFLLPAFPLAMMWLARGFALVARAFGPVGRLAFVGLLLAGATESVAVHPHHLMFYNAWAGGPVGGPRYLIHREDWGQDKRRLAQWQRVHGIDSLYYAPYGPNPERWGIVFEPVPCTPRVGVYALHAVEVHRPRFGLRPGCADWLTVEPPDERIGFSIYVYRVDRDRLVRLAREARDAAVEPFWRSGSRAGSPPRSAPGAAPRPSASPTAGRAAGAS